MHPMRSQAVAGALLGCALGDAIGLPYEALSKRRAARLLGAPDRHRFRLGRGMVSDDTEHSCLVAQALCASGGDVEAFRAHLARGLRWWLLGLPAGIGFATLRATLKLWLGFDPRRSGVYSAGNGPAMRSAVLGAAIEDRARLVELVRANTLITHSDPRAFAGALAVALAARQSAHGEVDATRLAHEVRHLCPDPSGAECADAIASAAESVARGEATTEFATDLGCARGVTGFVLHSVPVALHAWLAHPRDAAPAIRSAVECGGDTDTVAAIVGGIVGAGVGIDGLPRDWLDGLAEWPRSVDWMKKLGGATAAAMHDGKPRRPPAVSAPAVLARNLLFTGVVLGHVARRLLPPY